MNQRGCKINVKDGGEEHKMHEQSHSEVEQHIRGKQLTFEKSEKTGQLIVMVGRSQKQVHD